MKGVLYATDETMEHAEHCLEKCGAPMSGQQNDVGSEEVEGGGQDGVGGGHDGMGSSSGAGGGTRFNSGKIGKNTVACGQHSTETTEDDAMEIGQHNAGESERVGHEHGQRSASHGEQAMESELNGTENEQLDGGRRQGVTGGEASGMHTKQHICGAGQRAEQADATAAAESATHADSSSAGLNAAEAKGRAWTGEEVEGEDPGACRWAALAELRREGARLRQLRQGVLPLCAVERDGMQGEAARRFHAGWQADRSRRVLLPS